MTRSAQSRYRLTGIGAQTQRALSVFEVGEERFPVRLIPAFGLQKLAAVRANRQLGQREGRGGSPGSLEWGSDLGLDEMVADGEADDVGQRIQVELAHHRGAVRLHRLDAEVQARRDGFVAVPLG